MRLKTFAFACAAAALAAPAAFATTLPAPSGPVVLTIHGAIEHTNVGDTAQFDLAMLDALAGRTTTTKTPWYDGARDFSGPTISAVMEAVGAEGGTMRMVAVNDYAVEVPAADATEFPVIFATRIDGQVLSVRDKGPVFVVYPFDEEPDLYNETYFGRSAWQVVEIEIK